MGVEAGARLPADREAREGGPTTAERTDEPGRGSPRRTRARRAVRPTRPEADANGPESLEDAERQAAAEASATGAAGTQAAAADAETTALAGSAGPAARATRRAIPLEPLPEVPAQPSTDEPEAGEGEETEEASDLDRLALAAVEARPGRSPRAATCPFLRLDAADGLATPLEAYDERHRCLALDAPLPQSRPQQELVCLQPAHVGCPRYLAGLRLAGEAIVPVRRSRLPLSIVAAFVVLALAVASASAYMLANGGLVLPTAGASPTAVAGPPSAPPATPTSSPQPTAAPSPSPTPVLTPPPATLAPTPAATPPGPTPTTIASRFAGLERCPAPEDCYIYVVQRGNNLDSIARYFGTTLQVVLDLNPQIDDPNQIRAGDRVKLPPPPD